jgi:hypothetical protein
MNQVFVIPVVVSSHTQYILHMQAPQCVFMYVLKDLRCTLMAVLSIVATAVIHPHQLQEGKHAGMSVAVCRTLLLAMAPRLWLSSAGRC